MTEIFHLQPLLLLSFCEAGFTYCTVDHYVVDTCYE